MPKLKPSHKNSLNVIFLEEKCTFQSLRWNFEGLRDDNFKIKALNILSPHFEIPMNTLVQVIDAYNVITSNLRTEYLGEKSKLKRAKNKK